MTSTDKTSEIKIFNKIPFKINTDNLLVSFHLNTNDSKAKHIIKLSKEAELKAVPCLIYRKCRIQSRDISSVLIEGMRFSSKVLAENLKTAEYVFPHIVSCGIELELWSEKVDDLFLNFCAEEIKSLALKETIIFFQKQIKDHCPKGISVMNPGSLFDWNISEQTMIYKLMEGSLRKNGIRITDNAMLIPVKSISGIAWETDMNFTNCILCDRENCEGRKAPFNREMKLYYE